MKTELDQILDTLPRCHDLKDGLARGSEAFVFIDDAGALNILVEGGWLALTERKLGYLKADIAPFID